MLTDRYQNPRKFKTRFKIPPNMFPVYSMHADIYFSTQHMWALYQNLSVVKTNVYNYKHGAIRFRVHQSSSTHYSSIHICLLYYHFFVTHFIIPYYQYPGNSPHDFPDILRNLENTSRHYVDSNGYNKSATTLYCVTRHERVTSMSTLARAPRQKRKCMSYTCKSSLAIVIVDTNSPNG